MSEMRVVVMGAGGRMGRALIAEVAAREGMRLTGAVEAAGSPHLGVDAGALAGLAPLGVAVVEDALPLLIDTDAVLDFTSPSASVETATLTAQARIVHVIGTTGFSEPDEARIAAAARHATIVKSGNMSLGVNLLEGLTRKVAAALGPDWDIEIVETHHRHKADAPSGTALMLGRAAAAGRGVALEEVAKRGRDGLEGPRAAGEIGFAALRGGDVVGEHTVLFATEAERVEITHKAGARAIFARGAVAAALWGRGKGPGLFSMAHVLGLE